MDQLGQSSPTLNHRRVSEIKKVHTLINPFHDLFRHLFDVTLRSMTMTSLGSLMHLASCRLRDPLSSSQVNDNCLQNLLHQ